MRMKDRFADGTWNKDLSIVSCPLSLVPRPSSFVLCPLSIVHCLLSIIHTYLKRSKFMECKVAKISYSVWFKGSLFHNQLKKQS